MAITIHEFAHAWVADYKGDPTPRSHNRLTLNPLAHLDRLGTLLLVVVGFGWGKPVPIDEFNLKNPRLDTALIALAGPSINLVAAVAATLLIIIVPAGQSFVVSGFLAPFILVNLVLAFFNLLPIYPLDGSKILLLFFSEETGQEISYFLQEYSLIIFILALLPWFNNQSLVFIIINPLIIASLYYLNLLVSLFV